MGERPIHNLIIGLYPPRGAGKAPVILNCSVPEPSAHHLRDGLNNAGNERIAGTMLTYLAQAFQRCDEISNNPPTPPVPPEGKPLHQFSEAELTSLIDGEAHVTRDLETGEFKVMPRPSPLIDDLIAIAEGRKIVLLDDGHPVIVTPEEAVKLDLGQGGDTTFIGGAAGGSMGDSEGGFAGGEPGPAPAPLDQSGDPLAGAGGSPSNDSSAATDGSAAGEKHTGEASGTVIEDRADAGKAQEAP